MLNQNDHFLKFEYSPEKNRKRGEIEKIRRSDFQLEYSCKSQKVSFFSEYQLRRLDQAKIQILFLQSLQKKVVFEHDPLSVILVCITVISLK